MKEELQILLANNSWNITEAVIHEIIEDEYPMKSLLSFQEQWVEWWLVKCLEFEKDSIKFFNKHYKEIESIRKYMSLSGNHTDVPKWYSTKNHYAILAFQFIALEIYMNFVIEDL